LKVLSGAGEDFPGAFLARQLLAADSGQQFEPYLDLFHVPGSLVYVGQRRGLSAPRFGHGCILADNCIYVQYSCFGEPKVVFHIVIV
jgi:hypothetical protein